MSNKKYYLTGAQDWVPYFEVLFQNLKLESVLEFGLGLGTEFWCDHAKKVNSVELSVSDYNLEWTNKTKDKLKDYKNWECEYIKLPQRLVDANQNAIDNLYPLNDTSYLPLLESIVTPFMNKCEYDIIFVDPGIHNRGDIVNFCFGKSPIIAAHDTDRTGKVIKNIYGYNIVDVPDNYVEIHKEKYYCGTTFWIKKDLDNSEYVINLIESI